jgi:hypothetical protein
MMVPPDGMAVAVVELGADDVAVVTDLMADGMASLADAVANRMRCGSDRMPDLMARAADIVCGFARIVAGGLGLGGDRKHDRQQAGGDCDTHDMILLREC